MIFVAVIPLVYGVLEFTTSNLKWFMSMESLRKQQAIVLEIF